MTIKIKYRIANILNLIKDERAAILKFDEFKDKFTQGRIEANRREFLKNRELEKKLKNP